MTPAEANRRARAEYYRDPFAASKETAHGDAGVAYQRFELTLAELVILRREIESW